LRHAGKAAGFGRRLLLGARRRCQLQFVDQQSSRLVITHTSDDFVDFRPVEVCRYFRQCLAGVLLRLVRSRGRKWRDHAFVLHTRAFGSPEQAEEDNQRHNQRFNELAQLQHFDLPWQTIIAGLSWSRTYF